MPYYVPWNSGGKYNRQEFGLFPDVIVAIGFVELGLFQKWYLLFIHVSCQDKIFSGFIADAIPNKRPKEQK